MSQLSLFGAGMSGPVARRSRGPARRTWVDRATGRCRTHQRPGGRRLAGRGAAARRWTVLGAGGEVDDRRRDGPAVRTAFLPELYALAQRWHSPLGKQRRRAGRCASTAPGCGGGASRRARARRAGYRLGWVRRTATASGRPPALRSPRRVCRGCSSGSARPADGPAYRVVGVRRLVRLVELVGGAPAGVPVEAWPVAERAHAGHGRRAARRGTSGRRAGLTRRARQDDRGHSRGVRHAQPGPVNDRSPGQVTLCLRGLTR